MLKTLNIILVGTVMAAAAYTFGIKHQAELIEQDVRVLDRKIALEHETISLLQADWSLLNQPNRLQRLSELFAGDLALNPLDAEQIVQPDELPAEPVPKQPAAGASPARTASIVSSAR